MSFPIRSPRQTVGGLYVFGRILDKIRLHAATGELPEGYHLGLIPGSRTFDDRVCCFLRVRFEDLAARTLQGGSDEEILDWCYLTTGYRPDDEQIEIWNGFMMKRGWRDSGSAGLAKQKAAAGLGGRDDIQTFFDLMDAEEGRDR
jgi:gluconokinase